MPSPTKAELNALVAAGNLGGRSWGNVMFDEDEEREAARVARLTPAQRAAEAARAAAEKEAWNAGAEERAALTRNVMGRAERNYAEARARSEAGRAAVAAARANLNAARESRAAAASRFGSLQSNNRGSRRNNRASRRNNRGSRRNNRGAAARLPAGKMARECKTSNVAHAHGTTGEPCKFMHKDEDGFELLRPDQKRNGPPKGGRKTRKSKRVYSRKA